MTISGHEWTLLITALSLCAGLGLPGVASVIFESLSRPRAARRFRMPLGPVAHAATAA